jgi:hypothetical protein
MAARISTYTWQDVLSTAGRKFPKSLQDDFAPVICNMTQNYVWDKYDWRQSITTLPPFYMVPNEQDYGAPAIVIPSDFYGLRMARLIRTDANPPYRTPLKIIKDLEETHVRYLPHSICYNVDRKAFRLFPRFPANLGGVTYFVAGTYKNLPPLVTASTLTTILPFDDVYFEMWVETMKWVAFQLDNDPRAGQITVQDDQVQATGQAATMISLIMWAASREGIELGDSTFSPSEPLVTSGNYAPGMLGLGWYF